MRYKTVLEHPYSFRFRKRKQLKQWIKQIQLVRFEKGNSTFRRQWYEINSGRHLSSYNELDFVN